MPDPFHTHFIQSLRAFRRAALFSLFAWRLVGLLSLRLFVCWFDREGFLRTFWELLLGPLGLHFGSSEGCLSTILGSLGTSWAQFWGSGSSLGLHFWGSGAPVAALGLFGGPLGHPRCTCQNCCLSITPTSQRASHRRSNTAAAWRLVSGPMFPDF